MKHDFYDLFSDNVSGTIKSLMLIDAKVPPHAQEIIKVMVEIEGMKPSKEVSEEELAAVTRLLVLVVLATTGGSCVLRQAERLLMPVIPHILNHLSEESEKTKAKWGGPSQN